MSTSINQTSSKLINKTEYSFQFSFERSFEISNAKSWMYQHWTDSIFYSIVYVFIIFILKHLMTNRKPFHLKGALFIWNLALAIFSIMGSIRFLPDMFYTLKHFGFHTSVCCTSFAVSNKVSSFWTFMFSMSKLPELGDTLFIILRKQKLIFLHWYHHISVLIFAWYSFGFNYSPGRWYVGMNYAVHSFMYTYYACKSIGIRLPKLLAMFITSSQILQMIVGFYVTFYSFINSDNCHKQKQASLLGLLMYGSYFVLFVQFFINVYFNDGKFAIKSIEKAKCLINKKID